MNYKKIFVIALFFVLLFCKDILAQQTQSNVKDRAYERKHYKQRKVVPYTFLREADVFWYKRVW